MLFKSSPRNTRLDRGRRRLLQAAAVCGAGLVAPTVLAVPSASAERRLRFLNLHTGEALRTVYWAEGEYVAEGLAEINHVLRDHRVDAVTDMDPELLDLLYHLQQRLDSRKAFHVISAYRSPKTNAYLRANTGGVAKNSFHLQGKAIDLRVPGVPLARLRKAAIALKAGGVGYYPDSGFIHLDTGRVRHW